MKAAAIGAAKGAVEAGRVPVAQGGVCLLDGVARVKADGDRQLIPGAL